VSATTILAVDIVNADLAPTAATLALVDMGAICLVKQARLAAGLVPLTQSTALDHAAAHPTADIITTSYFDHVGPPGETAEARSLASGHVPSGGRQRTGREHRHGIVGSRHRCPDGGGVARPAGAPSEHPKHDLCDTGLSAAAAVPAGLPEGLCRGRRSPRSSGRSSARGRVENGDSWRMTAAAPPPAAANSRRGEACGYPRVRPRHPRLVSPPPAAPTGAFRAGRRSVGPHAAGRRAAVRVLEALCFCGDANDIYQSASREPNGIDNDPHAGIVGRRGERPVRR
jgi:hypothetical protein